jgi:hypothetical protein
MAKSNRLIKSTTLSGSRVGSIASLGAMCKARYGDVPDGFIQDEDHKGHKHIIVSDWKFKSKLRTIPCETPGIRPFKIEKIYHNEGQVDGTVKAVKTMEGHFSDEQATAEDELLDWCIDQPILEGCSISFEGDFKPARLDHEFRLGPRGFIRDTKSKEIYFGLIKL